MTDLIIDQIKLANQSFDHLYMQYVEPLNQALDPANQFIENIALTVFHNNVTADQLKFLGCLFFSLPLGFTLYSIKNPFVRNIYNLTVGLILGYFTFGGNIISSHIQAVIVYLLCAIFQKHAQKVVFIFSLLYLSAHHIYRQITDYGGWKMDVSVVLMINFCKFVSFGFCYSDGFRNEKYLSQDQKERAIKKLPNFLTFLSYINFSTGATSGPAFDFYEFDNFINLKNGYQNIPLPFMDAFKNLGIGLIYMAITAVVLPKFPINYLISDEYGNLAFYKKVAYYNIAVILIRVRYYTAWLMIQAAISSTGITYNDKSKKFDQIVTVQESLELSHQVKVIVDKWNKTIQVWLKRYVYFRLYSEEEIKKSKTKASYAQYATIIMSAFWHGFYPGYYIAFIQWAVLITVCKYFFKASENKPIFKFFEKFGVLYQLIRWVVNISIFNSFGVGFVLLSAENTWKFGKNIYFYSLFTVIALFAFFIVTNWGQAPPRDKKEAAKPKHE